jgi:SAM-dependent methyltransferase
MNQNNIKRTVRQRYAKYLNSSSCCDEQKTESSWAQKKSKQVGYTDEDLNSAPELANLGLGIGTPLKFSDLREGETIIDLGSGAGLDCFLASKIVGKKGRVIGVDMTPEMIDQSRKNVFEGGFDNVEFRLGEVENLPCSNNHVDVIISNCVINLVPNKSRVFDEAYRVLKHGGRMIISDIVVTEKLPEFVVELAEAYSSCISGAVLKEDYEKMIKSAGFGNVVTIMDEPQPIKLLLENPTMKKVLKENQISIELATNFLQTIRSVTIRGEKPQQEVM